MEDFIYLVFGPHAAITLGSVFKDPSWRDSGNPIGSGNQTLIGLMQGKYLPCCTNSLPPIEVHKRLKC